MTGPERFAVDVAAALGRGLDEGERLALAVSGGPDSMAMLALAHAAFPGRVVAATVDHRLRAASAEEAAMVAAWCSGRGIPHATLVPAEPIAGASIQARAREARYALLSGWAEEQGAAALLTAHHRDDQAETLLMRAARGSGVAGLAAVRVRRDLGVVPLIRPLLDWSRAELRAIVEAGGLPFVDDPSNRDDAFDRTRVRRLLEENRWFDAAGLARSAAHLAEAEQALAAWLDQLWAERARIDGAALTFDPAGLPRELRRRAVRRGIAEIRRTAGITAPAWSDATNVEPLLDALDGGRGATQAGVAIRSSRGRWRFAAAPPRRPH
ncbi:tRNA lysidine(34) synthetase TilS [Sphingomonas cannabina]|uniref:tRNA lysidine(34) synthetase TilS n=1 Tax=Sphingomonas cannabina TaxID=2899123 RepID=UPI001F22EB21|nr:tRNA lysidine(34) synthetase TilS [Sphingomonas cannabina]UIJ45491.1 tRNA lysidine(34) synthetase TilS [Sphingomonas cannabina]